MSSITNYLMLILIIRTSSIAAVGSYGLAYTSYFLAQSMSRAVSVEPLTVQTPTDNRPVWHEQSRRALGTALMCALFLALISAAVGVTLPGDLGMAFLALAVGLPFLLFQDAIRGALFADLRMRDAALNDTLFLIAQAGAYTALFLTHHTSPALLIVGWAVGAAVGAFVGLVQLRVVPRLGQQRRWFHEHRHLIPGYLADYLANRGAEQLTLVVIFTVATPGAAGIVTAARTLFAPLTTVQTGFKSYALPAASRMFRAGESRRLIRFTTRFAIAMVAIMLTAGVLLSLIPAQLGQIVFSSNWHLASGALWTMTLFSALNAAGFAIWLGCKATQRATATFVGRLIAGVTGIGLAGIGAAQGAANGAILGMAGGAAVLIMMMVLVLRVGLNSQPRNSLSTSGMVGH